MECVKQSGAASLPVLEEDEKELPTQLQELYEQPVEDLEKKVPEDP